MDRLSPEETLKMRVLRAHAKPGETIEVPEDEFKLYTIYVTAINQALLAGRKELEENIRTERWMIDGVWVVPEGSAYEGRPETSSPRSLLPA